VHTGAVETTTYETKRLQLFERHGFVGETRWVSDSDGRRTWVLDRAGDTRPTVLIHGGLSQAGSWCLVAGKLKGRVVILDRPGWGLSYPFDYGSVDFRQGGVDWLSTVVESLGVEDVDLVGASIGGYIAASFALAHPDQVNRLVMIGAIPGLHGKIPLPLRLMGNRLIGPLMARMKITDPEVNRKRVFANLVAHPENMPVDVLQDDIDAMGLAGAGHTGYTMMRSMCTLGGFRPGVMIADELPQLDCPVLFLWGDSDSFMPIDVGEQAASRMQDARVHTVFDAGHSLELDQPDVVVEQIQTFLHG
jgi:pimeloyl-ACP methyl ester carboxylesterase